MELEHRFEVPVGIESAWPSLLDMSQVAQCFPGATLTSSDGDTYTGSVKVKLGPIQLTYQGKARIVEADESAHRAVIEASGTASRSASTASMTVTATATPVAEDRTAVDMLTNLTITGRPAQFGRGVMVEVGNKILGQFADCLSSKLAAGAAGAAATDGQTETAGAVAGTETAAAVQDQAGSADAAGVGEPATAETPVGSSSASGSGSPTAAGNTEGAERSGGAGAGTAGTSEATAPKAASAPGDVTAAGPSEAGPRHAAANYTRSPEPIDLLGSAGPSIVKRVVPLILAVVALIVLRSILKRRRNHGADDQD